MIKISIVIPVYNCEMYLEECLDSVLCQTLCELEIICVDDGSTDQSSEIIRLFQEKDDRVILYQQENQGAGAARNLGICKARGKYIVFLDADDFYLDTDALEAMYHTCEVNGFAACGSRRKHLRNGILETEPLFQEMGLPVTCGIEIEYRDFQLDYDYTNFLFLRKLLIENNIYFPDYRRFQDPPFLVRALYAAGRLIIEDTYLYCYRLPDMMSRFDQKKTCDLLRGLIDNLLFAKEHQLETLFQNTVKKIDDEYADIICENISPDNLELLKLLMQANWIICEYYENESYVVQPLGTLMFCINQYSVREAIIRMIEKQKEIAVYGAGAYGKLFLDFLKKNHLQTKLSAFVVSDIHKNESHIEGIPVITFRDFVKDDGKLLFVTVRRRFIREVKEILVQSGYKNYKIVKEEFLHALAAEKNISDSDRLMSLILTE